MKITVKDDQGRDMDIRCFIGIHAYTPWTYRDDTPPMYKVCKRCGAWLWHSTSWDAHSRGFLPTKQDPTP